MAKFISEISSNHNNNLKRSLKMVKVSSEIGFDIVKFQLFKIDKLFTELMLVYMQGTCQSLYIITEIYLSS